MSELPTTENTSPVADSVATKPSKLPTNASNTPASVSAPRSSTSVMALAMPVPPVPSDPSHVSMNFRNSSVTAVTAGARLPTTWPIMPSIVDRTRSNPSFISAMLLICVSLTMMPSLSARSRSSSMLAAPSRNSGASAAPCLPKICTAAAARSAAVGSCEMASPIAANCCSGASDRNSATESPMPRSDLSKASPGLALPMFTPSF